MSETFGIRVLKPYQRKAIFQFLQRIDVFVNLLIGQRKSSILIPIQSEKSPDSGFFACDLWEDCIMPSFQKQITEINGEGMIAGYCISWL